LDPAKYQLPEPYPYKEAAAFFKQPEVTPADQLPPMKWSSPDVEGLVAFLVGKCDDTSRPGTTCSVTLLTNSACPTGMGTENARYELA